jgi:hypothetical protein
MEEFAHDRGGDGIGAVWVQIVEGVVCLAEAGELELVLARANASCSPLDSRTNTERANFSNVVKRERLLSLNVLTRTGVEMISALENFVPFG